MNINFNDFENFTDLILVLEDLDVIFDNTSKNDFIKHLKDYEKRVLAEELFYEKNNKTNEAWDDIGPFSKKCAEAINKQFNYHYDIGNSGLEVMLIAQHIQANYQGLD